jgi:hypothetical protein
VKTVMPWDSLIDEVCQTSDFIVRAFTSEKYSQVAVDYVKSS